MDEWMKIFEGSLNRKECLCGFMESKSSGDTRYIEIETCGIVEGRILDHTEHQKNYIFNGCAEGKI